ncbi:MAG: polysaccharide lyase 8 family protein [Chitinophagaceae bacterium]
MRFKSFFFCFAFLISITTLLAANNPVPHYTDPKLTLLKQQVLKDILSLKITDNTIEGYSTSMKADGSWADIDYTDKTRGGWRVNDHLVRLNEMAVAYKTPGTKWSNSNELLQKIISGLDYWFKNDFICPNWWYPQIGVPKVLAPTMLLVEDKLTPAQIDAGVKILERAKIGMTGQNKVWLSGNVIYRSLLTNDVSAVEAAVKAIQDEIVVSEGEGIQPDYSFHQHGTQQQFGNYGSAYAADMLKWANIFQSTPFQFDAAKIAILRNYLLEGMRWIIWKNKMDISACGRQLFPDAQSDKANSIQRIMDKMPLIDPAYKTQYQQALNDFNGDNHFWKSDMTVHRRNDFYASVKMSSTRVGGAESCNEENIQGYHLGDGATYFYQSGNEYTDIFPFWDWKLIPGTTTFHDDVPLPVLPCSGYNIPSDFVGGVSDGNNGIATLTYNRDNLHAQKSWFFFEDAIICLGAGIQSSENKLVQTSINQSFLNGDVLVKADGSAKTIANGNRTISNANWVVHDNWGYFFPGNATISLANQQQEGDWHGVLKRMPANTIKANMFTLWLNHGNQPNGAHYAYYVFPKASVSNIEKKAAAVEVTQNTAALQLVENKTARMAGLVFIQPAIANTKNFGSIAVDQPCVVMISQKLAASHFSLSDPTHKLQAITITINGNRKSAMASPVFNKEKNNTSFTITLPQGADAGKTVNLVIE